MNDLQSFLYNNIRKILTKDCIDYSILSIEDQYELYEICKAHEIHLLVYETFKISNMNGFDKSLLLEWKGKYLKNTLNLIAKVQHVKDLFALFDSSKLDVMVLKGFSYSRYYINPSVRRMDDIDLFVAETQITKACEILEDYGYRQLSDGGVKSHHLVFVSKGQLPIELHTELVDQMSFPYIYDMMYELFDDAYKTSYQGINFTSSSAEYELLFCIVHIYKHYCGVGFGFKQLCDLYYIISETQLDWVLITEKLKHYKILNFSVGIFTILNDDFNIEIPKFVFETIIIEQNIMNLFRDDIYLSGAFGFHNKSKYLSNHIADYKLDNDINGIKFKLYIEYLFPAKEHMLAYKEFQYCKRNGLLLPIAWIHRIFKHLLMGNISMNKNYINKEFINNRILLKKWVKDI